MQGVAGETHVPNTKEGANVRVEGHLRPSCDFREGLKVAVSRLTGATHEHDLLCAGRSGLALITALQTESK